MSYCYFGRDMHKNALFLIKNCKNRPALGTLLADPLASRGGPNGLRRLGVLPSEPRQKNIEKSWLRH